MIAQIAKAAKTLAKGRKFRVIRGATGFTKGRRAKSIYTPYKRKKFEIIHGSASTEKSRHTREIRGVTRRALKQQGREEVKAQHAAEALARKKAGIKRIYRRKR